MAHPTRFKFKKGNDWVYTDELEDYRRRKQGGDEPAPMPMIDISRLPKRAELDPERPLQDLFYNHKALRRYLALEYTRDEKGNVVGVTLRIRRGLPPEFVGVAQDILRKYQKPATPTKKKTRKRKTSRRSKR